MHRYTSFCIIHLLLLITIVSTCSSPIFAFESPSPRQTQSRILQDINNSNDTTSAITVPDDETNDTTPTVIPAPTTPDAAPAPVPMPVSPTTHEPTKKYEPESDDEEKDEEVDNEEKKLLFVKRFVIFIFTVLGLALLLYFRDAITFFVGTVCINTNQYGCKGCLEICFPCFFGSSSSGDDGDENLDQIIFETEDANLRRGLISS